MRAQLAPALLAAHRLIRAMLPAAPGHFRILLFHDVPVMERPAFAALVERLAARHRLLSPAQAEGLLAGERWDGGRLPCLISFDDGFASNLDVAETILARHGAKALFFVCPGLMDLPAAEQSHAIAANIFDGKRGSDDLSLMGWDGVERLLRLGHSVGNHTLSHRRLTRLSADQRAEEIGTAAERLTTRLGPVPWFAYTFGDIGSIDGPSLAEIGRHHRWCRSGIRGANHAGVHRLALRADHVELAGSAAWRDLAVDGGLDPLYRRQRMRLDALAAL